MSYHCWDFTGEYLQVQVNGMLVGSQLVVEVGHSKQCTNYK